MVELAGGIPGPFAGKMLADFGAEVVKVEPPTGDPARRIGPFPDDVEDVEASATFLHCNTNKRSVVADVTTAEGRAFVLELARTADVVIESSVPGAPDDLVDALKAVRSDLVVCSVTPFGRTGPYAGLPADEITMYAMGGTMSSTGLSDREPGKLGGNLGLYQCGNVAALAVLAALTTTERSGEGIHIDVANLETQAGSIDRRMTYLLYRAYTGRDAPREGGARMGPYPNGFYPTEDGYVLVACLPNWVPRMLSALGDDSLAERYAAPNPMADPELPELADAAMYGYTLARGRQAAMVEAQSHGWAVTALNYPIDLLADPHFAERGFFVDVEHPTGTIRQPGAPVRMDGGWALRRPAPLLGQHTDEVRAELGLPAPVRPASTTPARLPLEGIRVLDMTVVWAGPYATMLLGELGAEIVRIDNPWVFPTATRGLGPRPPKEVAEAIGPIFGGFPDTDPGERPWNRVALFTAHGRNKRSITLDLRKDEGREAFLRLVETADVIVENNAVGLWDKLGIDWATIHARNPRTIMVRMPSVGLEGPYRDFIGFGVHFETLCGLTSQRGYADMDPTSNAAVYHMDAASGPAAAFTVLMALRRRDRTGTGELIEFAQAENMLQHLGELFVDAGRTGRRHETIGNRARHRAPQGAYPSTPGVQAKGGVGDLGPDRWVTISVGSDAEWDALARLIGRDDLVGLDLAARFERHDELDAAIAAWTAARSNHEAFEACVAIGVAAAPVATETDCYANPQLRSRGFFRPNGSPDLGTHEYAGYTWQWSGPERRWGPIPVMGQDNEAVLRDELGEETYEALVAGGHISGSYLKPDGTPW